MRNIYDIIAEQKAIVDINIASYDLNHTNNHLISNDYYLQEGIGEAIKKGAGKVVELIKTIIRKIKELVSNVIGFFKKTNNEVESMEKQIKDAANAVGSSGAANVAADGAVNKAKQLQTKKAVKTPQGPSTKVDGLLDVLKSSPLELEMGSYQPLENFVKLTEDIFNSVDARIVESIEDDSDLSVFDSYVADDVFKERGIDEFSVKLCLQHYYEKSIFTKAPDKKSNIKVSWNADTIYGYAKNGAKSVQHFKKLEKEAEDSLNKLIRTVTSNPDQSRAEALVTRAANIISAAVNYFSRTVTKATSQYIAVCRRVTNDYCKPRAK